MTPEERRAYMSAYKANLAASARWAGADVVEGAGGYAPLAEPRIAVPSEENAAGNGPASPPASTRTPGTSIQYDDGVVTGTAGIASQMLGNRFDTAQGNPVVSSGSVTMITFDMVNTFFGSVVFSLFDQVSGTMANRVTSMARPGIMTGLNTLSVMSPTTNNAYQGGTFLAGIWQFDPTMTGLGVGTGTTLGQGHHAISLNDNPTGTGLTTVTTGGGGGLNAVFRVVGDVAVPVELMEFKVDRQTSNAPVASGSVQTGI